MAGSKAAAGRGNQATHSSRSARARSRPSTAWRTGPPSRTSTTAIRVRVVSSIVIQSFAAQDRFRALHDLARRESRSGDQLLHLLARRRLKLLPGFFDLAQKFRVL